LAIFERIQTATPTNSTMKLSKSKTEVQFPESELILNRDGSVYHLNLLPKHLSDVVISVGDPDRVDKVSQFFDRIEFKIHKREFVTHVGTYKGKRLTVISTGMGTDNIEIFLTELDALANINFKTRRLNEEMKSLKIIRIGTSGGLQEDLELGSHLASDFGVGLDTLMAFYKLQQTDYEQSVANSLQEKLELPFKPYCVQGSEMLKNMVGEGMVIGNTVTCPGFYAPQGRMLRNELALPNLVNNLTQFHGHDFRLTNFEMETAGYYALCRLMGHEVLSVNAIVANRITNEFAKDANKVVDDLIKRVLDKAVEL
jgi:uridine phosphorylase